MVPAAGLQLPQRRGRERLSAADASNVVLDARDQVNVFLMAGVLGPGGFVAPDGAVDLAQLRTDLGRRLGDPSAGDLGRFSERVHLEPPLHWEHCEPDLSRHVRPAGPVGGLPGLADLCASLMTQPLPLDRPLWELLVIPAIAPGQAGMVLRVHHAVADGVGGIRIVQRLFGGEPAGRDERPPPPPVNRERPRWRSPLKGATRVLAVFRRSVTPTVLLGPIGPRRGVAFADVDLDALARAARRAGATVNDALLAAVAPAAAAAMREAGEQVPESLPASVPVALGDRGTSGNAVGVMMVSLPVQEPDVTARLARVAAQTRLAKSAARAQGTFELTRTRWSTWLFARLARRQRFIALFVTNVRGPSKPLSVAGAPLLEAWPVAPIQGNVRLGITAISYVGRLRVAVHTDAAALPTGVIGSVLRDELHRIADLGNH